MKEITHIPKGYMCLTCKHLHRKCNHLPFTQMKVIHVFKEDNLKEVKCTDFERGEDRK